MGTRRATSWCRRVSFGLAKEIAMARWWVAEAEALGPGERAEVRLLRVPAEWVLAHSEPLLLQPGDE